MPKAKVPCTPDTPDPFPRAHLEEPKCHHCLHLSGLSLKRSGSQRDTALVRRPFLHIQVLFAPGSRCLDPVGEKPPPKNIPYLGVLVCRHNEFGNIPAHTLHRANVCPFLAPAATPSCLSNYGCAKKSLKAVQFFQGSNPGRAAILVDSDHL